MKEMEIGADEAGQRFDKFLKKYLNQASSGFIYKMLRKKNITLNGKKAEGREILAEGDSVRLFLSDETLGKFHKGAEERILSSVRRGMGIRLDVLFQNADILAVNKPAGMLCQRGNGPELSLSEYLPAWLLEKGVLTEEEMRAFRPSPVNRLDRNTSGIVLCGTSLSGSRFLSGMIRSHAVTKEYLCLAAGKMTDPVTARLFYWKDRVGNRVSLSKQYQKGMGVMETFLEPLSFSGNTTLVKAVLVTGKTHQIRATMAYLGYPILGDPKYGSSSLNRRLLLETGIRRQMLHAYRVTFPKLDGDFSDLSGVSVTAPPPDDFRKAQRQLALEPIDQSPDSEVQRRRRESGREKKGVNHE